MTEVARVVLAMDPNPQSALVGLQQVMMVCYDVSHEVKLNSSTQAELM